MCHRNKTVVCPCQFACKGLGVCSPLFASLAYWNLFQPAYFAKVLDFPLFASLAEQKLVLTSPIGLSKLVSACLLGLQRFGSLLPLVRFACKLKVVLTSPIGLSKLISACLLCKGLGLYHCCTKNWLEQVLPFCQLGSEQFRLPQFRRWLVVLFC